MKNIPLLRLTDLIIVVFLLISVVPAIAADTGMPKDSGIDKGNSADCPADNGNGHAYGAWEHNWKCNIPPAFSEVENLTIDSRIFTGTQYWSFLAAGVKEKQALLNYIDNASVPAKQKGEWTLFVRKMWREHPVEFDYSTGSPMLVPGNPADTFALTPAENATFQEIEQYIAEDMGKAVVSKTEKSSIITPQFSEPQHVSFTSIACQKEWESIPAALASIATSNAPVPDTWYDYPGGVVIHSLEHGYVPDIGFGLAPDKCKDFASMAKTNFLSHNYDAAFTNLGYASHFIEDLGQPYHTPPVEIIGLTAIDFPTGVVYVQLHNAYELFVAAYWQTPLPNNELPFSFTANSANDYYFISDPKSSAQQQATESSNQIRNLYNSCLWQFITDGKFDFENNPAIVAITKERVYHTEEYTHGLIRYVTGGQYPTLTVTATAGPGGSISPSGSVSVRYGESQSFTITPSSGYVIDQILVDGRPEIQNPYPFSQIKADHTISATFKPVTTPGTDWIWSRDGWGPAGAWQHTATWSGGSGSEYGPVMINTPAEGNHGEHGTDVSLNRGSTQSSVWHTFTDPSGVGYNTIEFKGLMTACDVPWGRWMTINVNGQQVFGGTASQNPPGNGVPFTVTRSFAQSPTVTVKITNGQNPAWGPRFAMHYYSMKLSRENTASLLKTEESSFVIPDGTGLVSNGTSQDAQN